MGPVWVFLAIYRGYISIYDCCHFAFQCVFCQRSGNLPSNIVFLHPSCHKLQLCQEVTLNKHVAIIGRRWWVILTVDGRNPAPVERIWLVVIYTIIYKVYGGAGLLPSTLSAWKGSFILVKFYWILVDEWRELDKFIMTEQKTSL